MPLIHQIEIASILNHRRISPWRPDWRYQRFLLGGLHTAMNIPNGRGKSTMVAVILGMLAWHPKCLKEVRTNHCAPPDYPFFTHIRIEITNRNVEQKDLLVDLTGPNDGERMVFGIYGNAGENNEFKFYAYRGTFDDCPIGRRHGNRVSLVGNDEFLSTLQRQEGRFPSSRKEEQVGEWRRFVAEHFDMSSIQQQLKYQLEKGAEGSSHYFEVKAKGHNYSAELFYKHLAPELLTDVMGGLGEEDEKGIEDTIHEKARGVILANRRTRQTATELEAAKEVLDVFESLNGFGIRMADALQEVGKHKEALSLEMAALSQVLEINPVVGIPRPPAPEHPAFYGHFVLQDGAWWLTDRGIGAIAGDEAKRINERADRNRISSQPIKASQLIDFACDLSPHYSSGNTPGQRGRLYSTTAAADLIRASNSFAPPWTKETALAAVDAGFKWAIEIADTNPVRLRINEIDQTVGSKRQALKDRQDASTKHREQLELREAEKLQLEAGQGAWNRMVASGLFADEELRNPKATGSEAARIKEEATQAKVAHLVKIERLKPLQEKLQAFQSEQGDAALPGAVADIFEAHQRDAKAAYEKITSQLKDARQLVPGLRAVEKSTRERSEQLERKLASIENEEGPASAFTAFFEGELPSDNLIKQVKDDQAKATQAQQEASIALAGLQKGMDAIEHFRAAYPDQEPGSWLEQRTKQRDWWNSELTRLKGERAEAQRKRFELETSPVAAGMVARQVMDVAGAGARPLHEVVAALNLPRDRQEAVLTLFSALLFSPVFAAEDDAVAAARKLADEHIEAPVFVEDTLAEFCRGQSISYADGIARSWMLGVRTRPVDCLIDPELVNREKAALDEHLATLDAAIQTAGNTIAELDPTGEPALLASRAKEALDEAVPEKVSALHTKLASIDGELPRLQLRASEEAIASIRSALRLAALLDDKSVDEWRALAQSTKDTAELAQGKLQVQEDLVDKLQEDQAPFGEACNLANLNALKVPDLRTLQAYVDSPDAGPQFMAAHEAIETRLEQAAEQARRRADFDFDAANGFVIAGGAEKLTVTLAAITLHVGEIDILGSEIVQLNDGITSLGDEKAGLSAPSYQLDTAVIKFRQALNDLKAIVPDPVPMTNEQLEMKPLYGHAQDWRGFIDPADLKSLAQDMLDMADELTGKGNSDVQERYKAAQRKLGDNRKRLGEEIDRALRNSSLKLAQIVRVNLEQARSSPEVLTAMLDGSRESYNKNKEANRIAQEHLDKEWDGLSEWLRNFTLRLPDNLATMKRVFAPGVDKATGRQRAGFVIEGTIIDQDGIRTVLEEIIRDVEKVEDSEQLHQDMDRSMRDQINRSLREKIRETFYRRVIVHPRMKLVLPAMSDRALEIQPNMASSGQGVAITFLWILKLADFVNEREIRRDTVDGAKRRRRRQEKTSFTFLDGAFSHISDKALINGALDGIEGTQGRFQLIITGHDPAYQNDFKRFPAFIAAREIGGHFMYADSHHHRMMKPDEVGSTEGAIETFHAIQLPRTPKPPASEVRESVA